MVVISIYNYHFQISTENDDHDEYRVEMGREGSNYYLLLSFF